MLERFLDRPEAAECTSLVRVVASGERLSSALERRFFERFDAGLFNLYGPAEAAADVTVWACERESARASVPIGWPIANTRIYASEVPAGRLEPEAVAGTAAWLVSPECNVKGRVFRVADGRIALLEMKEVGDRTLGTSARDPAACGGAIAEVIAGSETGE